MLYTNVEKHTDKLDAMVLRDSSITHLCCDNRVHHLHELPPLHRMSVYFNKNITELDKTCPESLTTRENLLHQSMHGQAATFRRLCCPKH
jgi:hypothetical protein